MPCGVELSEGVIEPVDAEVEEGFVRLRKEKSIELVRPSRQPTEIPAGTVSKVQGKMSVERRSRGPAELGILCRKLIARKVA